MPIDIGGTTIVAEVVKPDSLVCPKCKKETGKKTEDLIKKIIDEDFCCPFCNEVVFSKRPEVKSYHYANSYCYEYD